MTSPTKRLKPRSCSGGFTLLELMLVLAIMVAVGAVAVPAYQGYVVGQRLDAAAGQIEMDIKTTRLEAIRTGQIQTMRFAVGDRQYAVQPWLSADDAANASAGASIVSQSGQVLNTDSSGNVASVGAVASENRTLDESVLISDAQVMQDLRGALQTGATAVAADAWSPPLMFYPDGSTSTAQIMLQNTRGTRVAIAVRGVTGQPLVLEMTPAAL
jgi:prepilin-type N-terminal cleavage/methylation domain-containing protein